MANYSGHQTMRVAIIEPRALMTYLSEVTMSMSVTCKLNKHALNSNVQEIQMKQWPLDMYNKHSRSYSSIWIRGLPKYVIREGGSILGSPLQYTVIRRSCLFSACLRKAFYSSSIFSMKTFIMQIWEAEPYPHIRKFLYTVLQYNASGSLLITMEDLVHKIHTLCQCTQGFMSLSPTDCETVRVTSLVSMPGNLSQSQVLHL